MSRILDPFLKCAFSFSLLTFGLLLTIALVLPAPAMASSLCSNPCETNTACTYTCGPEADCTGEPAGSCGCTACNTCCVAN